MSQKPESTTTPDLERILRLRLDLSQIVEPEDWIGMQLIHHLELEHAHDLITHSAVTEHELSAWLNKEQPGGGGYRRSEQLKAALRRWRARIPKLNTSRLITQMQRINCAPIVPEETSWPIQLEELGADMPLLLWVRGNAGLLQQPQVAIVGARASTTYGTSVTEDLVGAIMSSGHHITSGGAYGIDAAAHHAALRLNDTAEADSSPVSTIAVLAGGIDRMYPAGNRDLLHRIQRVGVIVSEVVPGRPPSRFRFLSRNRIIAALASLTIVVEAQHRSGALNTAHHALKLGRAVGAVPGSVYASSSAGCHRLIQETPAELICHARDINRLLAQGGPSEPEATPSLDLTQMMVLDCLPVSTYIGLDGIVERTGLPVHHVLATLTQLAQAGYALERDQMWRSAGRSSNAKEQDEADT